MGLLEAGDGGLGEAIEGLALVPVLEPVLVSLAELGPGVIDSEQAVRVGVGRGL
jgi:hypothetical protein